MTAPDRTERVGAAPAAPAAPQNPLGRWTPAARAQRVGLGVVLALGLLDAWRFLHYQANPDGVSYIDIARDFAARGPSALVNGYWSPGLPAAIGVAFRIVPPTIDTMYAIAHVVTFVSFLVCALTFHRLLFVLRHRIAVEGRGAREVALVAVGWAAFALLIVKGIGINLITPDMGVAAVVFWLAAEAFSLGDGAWPVRRWIVAGVVLGVGYWWKAILFPVALVWLACASAVALRRRDGVRGAAAGWLAFIAVAAVLAVPVSHQVGRMTFGEAGRLNYLWYVNAAPYVWERCVAPEGLDASAASFGGVRTDSVVVTHPMTCAIDSRSSTATLPLWFDPSVYYRTTHTRIDLAGQWRAIRNDVGYIAVGAGESAPVLLAMLGVLAVWMFAAAIPGALRSPRDVTARNLILLPLVVAPVVFYVLVYVEFRHVAPFLLVGGMLAALRVARASARSATLVLAALLAAAAVDVVWRLSTQTLIGFALARSVVMGRAPERIPDTQIVARALAAGGLTPGTRVASLNDAWNAEWAQLGGLRIRAHVPEWTTPLPGVLVTLRDPCTRADWDAALRRSRIAAVVARIPTGLAAPPAFDRVANTEFFVHRTDAPGDCRQGRP